MKDCIGSKLPNGLTIEHAIGLFHVHAHKDECFFRFATSFIPGAAICAGKILESLWSVLNAISLSAHTSTLAHRVELLDDHACDSNHKKCLGMTSNLCKQYKNADKTYRERQDDYEKQSNGIDAATLSIWHWEVVHAEATHLDNPAAMDIYMARVRNVEDALHGAVDHSCEGPRSPVQIYFDLAVVIEGAQ